MNNTIKSLITVAAFSLASFASASLIPSSGEVTITDTIWDGAPSVNGGELDADFSNGHQAYTFCVERGVPLAGYSKTYLYELSDEITSVAGDKITAATAYLVKLFALGQLYERDFGPEGGAHDVNAGALQMAIWYFEGQGGAANAFVAKAINDLGIAAAMADYQGGEVKVVQLLAVLTDAGWEQGEFQDQVVYVPDSGATLFLLGLGVAGLAFVRRKL